MESLTFEVIKAHEIDESETALSKQKTGRLFSTDENTVIDLPVFSSNCTLSTGITSNCSPFTHFVFRNFELNKVNGTENDAEMIVLGRWIYHYLLQLTGGIFYGCFIGLFSRNR